MHDSNESIEAPIQVLGEGHFLRLIKKDRWEYCERKLGVGVSLIIAVVGKEILLVEQFRGSMNRKIIELPAGLVGDEGDLNESLERAAYRELLEETGYRAQKMTQVVEGPISTGISNEFLTFFWAEGLERVSAGGGDSKENITVHHAPIDGFEVWCHHQEQAGLYIDPKVFIGLYFASRNLKTKNFLKSTFPG